jgi:hypothetical protein
MTTTHFWLDASLICFLVLATRRTDVSGKLGSIKKTQKEFEDVEYDRLASKYARDLKRINNGHREYGNVKKKNVMRSQKVDLDLR